MKFAVKHPLSLSLKLLLILRSTKEEVFSGHEWGRETASEEGRPLRVPHREHVQAHCALLLAAEGVVVGPAVHGSFAIAGNLLLVQNHICKWQKHPRFGSGAQIPGHGCILKHIRSSKRYSSKSFGASISCSTGVEKDFFLPPITQLAEAKMIYSVAPAMGHNKSQSLFGHNALSIASPPTSTATARTIDVEKLLLQYLEDKPNPAAADRPWTNVGTAGPPTEKQS